MASHSFVSTYVVCLTKLFNRCRSVLPCDGLLTEDVRLGW